MQSTQNYRRAAFCAFSNALDLASIASLSSVCLSRSPSADEASTLSASSWSNRL